MTRMLVAAESAVLYVDGEQYVVHRDVTRVEEGHALLRKNAHMFKPLEAHYKVETARQEPKPEPKQVSETRTRRRTRDADAASGVAKGADGTGSGRAED